MATTANFRKSPGSIDGSRRMSSHSMLALGCLLVAGAALSHAQRATGAAGEARGAEKDTAVRKVRYTVVDRGPSLVRNLVNTPGLNTHGDLAVWDRSKSAPMQGVVFHGQQTLQIVGDKDFSLVYPADLNDRLTVVGSLQGPQDIRFTRAFQWSNNHLEILGLMGGTYSTANAINETGNIVGSAESVSGERHAVLWRSGQPRSSAPQDLGLLGQGDFSAARDINDRNEIVGEANVVPKGNPQAFLWRAGKMQKLGNLPGGTFCSAQALNDKGEITGWCDLPNGASHGVVWNHGRITDLGTLGEGDSPSTALDINSHGQVVGSSEIRDSTLRAFLWENGQMSNLNMAISAKSGWLLLVASRINDRGEIAGRGYHHGSIHAFLLQPVQPAPAVAGELGSSSPAGRLTGHGD